MANTNIMAIFIVLQGKLGVVVENHEVTKLQPGEIVGEMSLIDTRPTSATVLSDGPAHVLELDKAALVARLAANTGFAARFYKAVAMALSDRLRGLLARDEPHHDDPHLRKRLESIADEQFARLVAALQ